MDDDYFDNASEITVFQPKDVDTKNVIERGANLDAGFERDKRLREIARQGPRVEHLAKRAKEANRLAANAVHRVATAAELVARAEQHLKKAKLNHARAVKDSEDAAGNARAANLAYDKAIERRVRQLRKST